MPIPAALFNRRRGRESGTSSRYTVRRAGGGTPLLQRGSLAAGSSVMARTRSRAGRVLLRRRPLSSCREDRISALPDELLLLILRRLNTRTALGTGVLSRRWAHLPRELPSLDLRVGDLLPPRYHRWVRLYHDIYREGAAYYRRHAVGHTLLPNIWRYERRAMRAFTGSAESFLEGPRRKVDAMRLEFFITGNADGMNRLIAEAIGSWGVKDLEAVAKPPFGRRDGFQFHCFPSHGLCIEPRVSHLQSLKLRGCTLPPLHEYSTLSVLVLQDIPKSTPKAAYECIFTSCLQLRTLHLISCGCSSNELVADAPNSEIRELVVENCTFGCLCLRALPLLERVASGGVIFESDSFPFLKQRNITLSLGVEEGLSCNREVELDTFLLWTPDISSLIIRFTGPYRWIVPSSSSSAFLLNLRRLLVADVPSSWDVTWTFLLLELAPCLETLHVHIAPYKLELGEEIHWVPTKLRHHHLNEFMVAGFKGTARQIYLVKFVLGACTMLRHVAMFKNGYAQDKGRWDWEMATQQQLWTDEEKEKTLKQIMDGVPSSTAPVQLVLG